MLSMNVPPFELKVTVKIVPSFSSMVNLASFGSVIFPCSSVRLVGAILKKWTAKSERWYNNKKRRETHGKHQVYRGIQAKHSKLV